MPTFASDRIKTDQYKVKNVTFNCPHDFSDYEETHSQYFSDDSTDYDTDASVIIHSPKVNSHLLPRRFARSRRSIKSTSNETNSENFILSNKSEKILIANTKYFPPTTNPKTPSTSPTVFYSLVDKCDILYKPKSMHIPPSVRFYINHHILQHPSLFAIDPLTNKISIRKIQILVDIEDMNQNKTTTPTT